MELNSCMKLRRFCFLGSFHPVYIRSRGKVDVHKYCPILTELFENINDAVLLPILNEVLVEINLDRRDEALFVYAAYLLSTVDWQWRRAARLACPQLLMTDNDLFLFISYAKRIQRLFNRKTISRTICKAIVHWYKHQSPKALWNMWLTHRGAHGITHESLLKMCHINDTIIGEEGAVLPFFKMCTELLCETQTHEASPSAFVANVAETVNEDMGNVDKKELKIVLSGEAGTEVAEKLRATKVATPDIVLAVSKLRTTKCETEALKIIQAHKLSYNQVPSFLLRHATIMEAVIPTMSYMQLLGSCRLMARHNYFANEKILTLYKTALANRKTLHKSDLHPIRFLIMMRNLGERSDLTQIAPRKVHNMQMKLYMELYINSFGLNIGIGQRMHITINLQSNIRSRLLKNQNKISYLEASVTLAFAYFKTENFVEVFYWSVDHLKLEKMPWTKEMGIKEAFACCEAIQQQSKTSQRLVAPVMHGLARKQIYDIFLAIVPTAGRGNPKHSSAFLCQFLDKYRQTKNPNAKYVIVELLKCRQSLHHSDKRNENIMEICGLDINIADLIKSFALNHIGTHTTTTRVFTITTNSSNKRSSGARSAIHAANRSTSIFNNNIESPTIVWS